MKLCPRPGMHNFPRNTFTPVKLTWTLCASPKQYSREGSEDMPPRSVCLNVFTSSLGEAVRDENGGNAMGRHPIMERRDSAQSDVTRRSSAGSIASAPTPPPTFASSIQAFNRADMFRELRPMASTESLNFTMNSKPCSTCSGGPAKRRCSRCKAAYYCDKNCQKSDWKTHRNVCEPAQQTYSAPATPTFSNPTSPTNES